MVKFKAKFILVSALLSSAVFAAELPIQTSSKSDLTQESQKLSLSQESLLTSTERAEKDLLSIGITSGTKKNIIIKTPEQDSKYDLNTGIFASYRTPIKELKLGTINFSGQAAYQRAEQNDQPIQSALHIVPITAKTEFTLRRFAVQPSFGLGIQGIYLSQQGAQSVKTTELDSAWLISAGISIPSPWTWKFKVEAEQYRNIDSKRSWAGTNWNAGVSLPL